jgi:hypothetical protein
MNQVTAPAVSATPSTYVRLKLQKDKRPSQCSHKFHPKKTQHYHPSSKLTTQETKCRFTFVASPWKPCHKLPHLLPHHWVEQPPPVHLREAAVEWVTCYWGVSVWGARWACNGPLSRLHLHLLPDYLGYHQEDQLLCDFGESQ